MQVKRIDACALRNGERAAAVPVKFHRVVADDSGSEFQRSVVFNGKPLVLIGGICAEEAEFPADGGKIGRLDLVPRRIVHFDRDRDRLLDELCEHEVIAVDLFLAVNVFVTGIALAAFVVGAHPCRRSSRLDGFYPFDVVPRRKSDGRNFFRARLVRKVQIAAGTRPIFDIAVHRASRFDRRMVGHVMPQRRDRDVRIRKFGFGVLVRKQFSAVRAEVIRLMSRIGARCRYFPDVRERMLLFGTCRENAERQREERRREQYGKFLFCLHNSPPVVFLSRKSGNLTFFAFQAFFSNTGSTVTLPAETKE